MNKTAERWLKQGLHDFENAKKNYKIKAYDVCLFLCEQSVEKALKAYYYKKFRKNPPKVHSIEKLMELVQLPEDLNEFAVELDDYYLALRYPDVTEKMPYEMCERKDAKRGLELTDKLIKDITKRLKSLKK